MCDSDESNSENIVNSKVDDEKKNSSSNLNSRGGPSRKRKPKTFGIDDVISLPVKKQPSSAAAIRQPLSAAGRQLPSATTSQSPSSTTRPAKRQPPSATASQPPSTTAGPAKRRPPSAAALQPPSATKKIAPNVSDPAATNTSSQNNIQQNAANSRPVKTITADFLEIDWTEIGFVKAQLDHGKQLLKANHMFNIKEIREEGKPVQITAICLPEVKISELYNIFFILDKDRKVTTSECHPCPFGAHACKHKAALAQFINTHRTETQTDKQCEWLKPSNHRLKLYPKGESLEKIENLPAEKCCPKLDFKMISDSKKDTLAELMRTHNVTRSPLFKIVSQKYPSNASPSSVEELPSWMKDLIFVETNEKDVPYRVIYLVFN